MARVDYYNDPRAPQANSVVPSVTVAVLNSASELLLIHKVDNGYWALPGGAMELDESLRQAAVREVTEETAIECRITGLVGIYADPQHVMAYDDGEVRREFSICFHAVPVTGQPTQDDIETNAAKWIPKDQIRALNIHPAMRLRIDDALSKREPNVV